MSDTYRARAKGLIIDEAHCIEMVRNLTTTMIFFCHIQHFLYGIFSV